LCKPKPKPLPDRVVIRQQVIALNSLDYKQRDFGILISRWPHMLGIEGAGVIEAMGSDVSDLRSGDEVLAWMAGRPTAKSGVARTRSTLSS
jgi:NADPH:quinone reductase-like Zn-dependent oxidoreductase